MRGDAITVKCEAGRDGPQPAVGKDGKPTGNRLCGDHFDQLDKTLMSIEDEAAHMAFDEDDPEGWAAVPTMAIALGGSHGSTLASQQTPVRLDAIVLSDSRTGTGWAEDEVERHAAGRTVSALRVLCYWTERLREGRAAEGSELSRPVVEWVETIPGANWPVHEGPACPWCDHDSCRAITRVLCARPCDHPMCRATAWWRVAPAKRTVKTERRLLSRQLPWIARQDWVPEFYRAMRSLLGQLQQANGTSAPRPIPGKCPNLLDGKECGGPLWPIKPKHTSGEDAWKGSAPDAVRCGSCSNKWEGAGPLALLAIILDKQKKAKANA